MKLAEHEADLFFDLMWKLQWFINKEYKIIHPVKNPEDYKDLGMEEKVKVRQCLFDDFSEITKSFLDKNPFKLNSQELEIIKKWGKAITGTFFIERFLKSYTVFIDQDSEVVYGVFSLYDPLSEMIDKRDLPICVEGILLPFKDKIIYDGVFETYPILFGGNITSELKEIYLTAKQNKAIITNLDEPKSTKTKRSKSVQDWQPQIQELIEKAKKLRGGGGQPSVYSPVFSLLKLSLDLADKATSDELDIDYFYKKIDRLNSLLSQIENQLHRMER